MMSRTCNVRLLVLALCLGASLAHAKVAPETRLDLSATATASEFEAQRARIITAIADPDDYAELRAADRKDVKDGLGRIGEQLSTADSLAQLPDDQRAAVLAQQDEINETLATARADSRMVCAREQAIGSNFRRSVCLTAAQRRRDAEAARGIPRDGRGS